MAFFLFLFLFFLGDGEVQRQIEKWRNVLCLNAFQNAGSGSPPLSHKVRQAEGDRYFQLPSSGRGVWESQGLRGDVSLEGSEKVSQYLMT
jgi:hypothetical protein